MRPLAGYALAIAAAAGLHWAAFALWSGPAVGGAEDAGAGGDARVTLAASSAQMAALVAEWERPPEASVAAPEPSAPPVAAPDPALAAPEATPPRAAALRLPAPPAAPPKADKPPVPPQPPQPPKAAPKPAAKPAKPAKPASSVAAQRAAGAGGGAVAGQGKAGGGASKDGAAKAQAAWTAKVMARIERKKRAPAGGATGRVVLRLRVAASGALQSVAVLRGAGVAVLDHAAVQAVQRAAPFPPSPPEMGAGPFTLELPLRFVR